MMFERNTESSIRLFTDDCIILVCMENNEETETLQRDLNRLGEWATKMR
jgi:hypothetical protein